MRWYWSRAYHQYFRRLSYPAAYPRRQLYLYPAGFLPLHPLTDARPMAPWQAAKLVPWVPLPVLLAAQPSEEEQMTSYHSQKQESRMQSIATLNS